MQGLRLWAVTLCLLLDAAVSSSKIAIFQPPFDTAMPPGHVQHGHVPLAIQDCPSDCGDVFHKLNRDSGIQDTRVHELGGEGATRSRT